MNISGEKTILFYSVWQLRGSREVKNVFEGYVYLLDASLLEVLVRMGQQYHLLVVEGVSILRAFRIQPQKKRVDPMPQHVWHVTKNPNLLKCNELTPSTYE